MFVLRMAARELRSSWRRLLFFFICVAIGVGSIVALRSVIQSVRGGLTSEARSIIGGDVLVQTNRAWTSSLRASLQQRFDAAPVLSRMDAVETATLVRAESGDVAKMVELRGVQEGFPYYGTIVLEGGGAYSHDLLRGGGVLVRPELLTQLGIARGDRIIIGGRRFTVRGVILQEPGRRVGAFSFGSRVLVDYDDLQRTGLLTFGSRASYQILLRVREDGVAPLVQTLRRDFRDQFVSARSYRSTEDQIGEDLQRAENYLSLVGFIIVVLGGIGVWSVTRVFVRQKIRSVAILKCVGASSKQVLATYVLQVMLLGLTGSLFGVGLAAIAMRALPASISTALGGLTYGLTPSAVIQGTAVGVLVSLLFSLVPLLDVRRIKPLLLLRGGNTMPAPVGPRAAGAAITRSRGTRRSVVRRTGAWLMRWLASADWLQIGVGVLVSLALVGVAAWQAASLRAGAIVCLGFAGIAIVLHVAGAALVRAIAPLAAAPWFPLRHAVVSLRRPGNQTRVILLAVGLGSFFVLGVRALQTNLLAEFSLDVGRAGADLFLIDIQQDQAEGVRAFLRQRAPDGNGKLVPVLRARVTAVRGRDVNLESYSDVRGRSSLSREYVITYRNNLEPNEKILSGTFWTDQPPLPANAAELEVSIERRIHERNRVGLGDRMRFDVLGRVVEARVTSIREVDWQDSRNGGFMFVFRPGPLSQAPHTFVGFLRGPEEPVARAKFQRDLVAAYPNVSAVDIREVLASVNKVVETVTLAISIVGGVALASGILILIGAVAMTKFQRVYEAAILRTLGAGTRLLATMLALEYSALGLLAGLIGAGGALGLSWAVCRYVFEIDWRPAPVLLTAGAVLTMLLVAAIGVLASADVLSRKPLATLRAE